MADRERTPATVALSLAGALGVALLVAAFTPRAVLAGPPYPLPFVADLLVPGLGALLLVGLYALAPPVYAAGVGLAVAAVLVAPPTPTQTVVAAAGATLVLARDARTARRPTVAALALLSSAAVLLTAATLATVTLDALWQAALVLVAVGATLVYGMHRYERVRMGLVSDT